VDRLVRKLSKSSLQVDSPAFFFLAEKAEVADTVSRKCGLFSVLYEKT